MLMLPASAFKAQLELQLHLSHWQCQSSCTRLALHAEQWEETVKQKTAGMLASVGEDSILNHLINVYTAVLMQAGDGK